MKPPRSSDAAVKQILDSTRVYREYARARKASQQLPGSLFWKKVGSYEYLARKVQVCLARDSLLPGCAQLLYGLRIRVGHWLRAVQRP